MWHPGMATPMTRTCPHCMLPLPGRVYEAAGVRLDPETHQITVDGRPPQRKLARHEFIILSTLMRRPFMPFSVEVLLDQLGSTTRADDPLKYVQILVYRIRQVIGPSRIETLRGFGSYQMAREAPKPVLPGYADHLIRKPDGQPTLWVVR